MRLKYQILAIGLTAFTLIFLQPVYAQQTCETRPAYYTKGLASTPNLGSNLKKTADSKCIVDPKAAFAPYKIPSYDDLKSLYYTQSKITSKNIITTGTLPASFSSDGLYWVQQKADVATGNLTINNSPTGSGTEIIFVDGNLTFDTANYIYGSSLTGTVFVVEGNVNINQNVAQIDAVIISEGTICTAHDGTSCLDGNIVTPPLTINGSLISIDQNPEHTCPTNCPIKFRRKLANNSDPAEKIIHQPKYLVILRNLMSDTLQKWSEIQ